MKHSTATFNKIWSKSYIFQNKATIVQIFQWGPSTTVSGYLCDSVP